MTSFQSQLGEGGRSETTAQELAEGQRSISIAEFFEKNKQMLGFDSDAKALVTAVKEACDNSLTWSTPFVYRSSGETKHRPIGEAVDDLIESNREDVQVKRGGDLEKLRVENLEALSFDDGYDLDFRRISSVFRHRVNSDIYRITVEGRREVELTDYHSVFVLRDGEIRSVETSDINEDDYVVLPDSGWSGEPKERIDLLAELLELPPETTEPVGLYGVEHLLERYHEEILEAVDEQYRMSDFRKCDRLPLDVVRDLDLDVSEYEDCELGYRFGGAAVPAVLEVTDELAELLGLYAAEGCVTGSRDGHEKVYLSLGSHEKDLIQYAESLVESVFSLPASTVDAHETATNVTIPSKMVGLVLKQVFEAGTGAPEKRIPRFVFDFPARTRERFLLGYGAGDGYPTEDVIQALRGGSRISAVESNRITFATTSERLASGLRYLCSSVDYDTTQERKPGETRTIDGREAEFDESYLLHLRTDQSATSRQKLPADELVRDVEDPKLAYNLDGRQTRVESDHALALADGGGLAFRNDGRRIAAGDLSALPVTDIERIDYEGEWVYDVSVPGDENFMAGTAPLACHNSLDATEEAGILPDIYVEIEDRGDYYRLVVEDNGPGITKEQVPKVFGKLLYGSRFHAREQKRGQQGIGISAAVLYAQLTSGKPARITSKTENGGDARYFELTIDTDINEPEIDVDEAASWERPHGTRIELEMEANMRARQQLQDYIKYTAVVNPHARIEFHEPSDSYKFERATDELPPETEEIRPHPHGVELGTLLKILEATDSYSVSGFLQGEFTRVGAKTADAVRDNLRDRHFGREAAWRPPQTHQEADVETAVRGAVANKSSEATKAFAAAVAETLADRERVAHSEVVGVVESAAADVADDFDETFGATVREKAVEAAWEGVTDERAADCYELVDEATTERKDDAAIEGLGTRLAEKFESQEDGRNRVTRGELREFIDRAADATEEYDDAIFGDTARENVTDAVWERAVTVPDEVPKVSAVADDRDAAARLLEAMRETDILAPPTDCLAPISEELVDAGLRKEYGADFYAAATREAEVHGGDPFVVEAGIAYGGDLEDGGAVEVLRFANRVPLVYQRGACATVDVVKDINWRNYGLDQPGGTGMPNGPAVLMVHVASTNVPFTSESKDAVANVPEIEDEIELALREAARELKSYLNKRRSLEKRRRKQNVIADILPEMAEKLSEVTGRESLDVEDSLARIMNNVLVERTVNGSTVELSVHNFDDTGVDAKVTEIVTADPGDHDDATVVEMDGEWFLKWSPDVPAGETATLSYEIDGDADFDVSVEGIEAEKLTINA